MSKQLPAAVEEELSANTSIDTQKLIQEFLSNNAGKLDDDAAAG